MSDVLFKAIADPTRRKIIHLLARKTMNLNEVAEHFPISRPAISKHMRVLTQCGLVKIRQQGRERFCEAKLQKLSQVAGWAEQYRHFWNSRLDALEDHLAKSPIKSPSSKK